MKLNKYLLLTAAVLIGFSACSDDDDKDIKNDFLKKTISPAIVGEKLEFAYAMGTTSGKLGTAEVTASIAGGEGTIFDLNSYYTHRLATELVINGVTYRSGDEVPLRTVKETSTNGSLTTATMEDKIDEIYLKPSVPYGANKVDMIAATVRYYYTVPEEARGKEVSFTFSSKSSDGESASVRTPSYKISKMDMKRLIDLTSADRCYFSIENMAAYTKAEVEARNLADKIDFIYIYQDKLGDYDYGHTFVSTGTDPKYVAIPSLIPSGWTKVSTPMERRIDVRDAQLKGSIPNVFIDDVDFETLNLEKAVDYTFGILKDQGAFMKTADGKYAAYIYVNSVDNNGEMTISIKRLKLN